MVDDPDLGDVDDDPLLTVPEIAKQLRLTEWTIREWIKAGKLHGWRAGVRRYRVRQSELERFLREREAPRPQTQGTERISDRLRFSDDT
jgi:excisionase family DNA binding protein